MPLKCIIKIGNKKSELDLHQTTPLMLFLTKTNPSKMAIPLEPGLSVQFLTSARVSVAAASLSSPWMHSILWPSAALLPQYYHTQLLQDHFMAAEITESSGSLTALKTWAPSSASETALENALLCQTFQRHENYTADRKQSQLRTEGVKHKWTL